MEIKSIKQELKVLWDFMSLDTKIEKSDLIIGCGCANIKIPIKCAELYKKGYAKKILFAGGYGKITKDTFKITEAEMFKNIAIEEGVPEEKIILENKSTNTGDNFRYSLKIIQKNKIEANKIIIVHNHLSERRTYSAAKAIIKNAQIYITSPETNFDYWISSLKSYDEEKARKNISVVVGDVQRLIIFPQFGWQIKQEVPEKVKIAYQKLKKLGFDKYIFTKEQIENLIKEHGLKDGQSPIY